MAAYRRVYDSRHLICRLTAKIRDQLRNPTLGKRVWATYTYLARIQLTLEFNPSSETANIQMLDLPVNEQA